MTETTKDKPGRPKKGEAPAFDFTALTFVEAELPKKPSNNPFTKPLGESYEYDTARQTTVPEAALRRVESLIRQASNELKIGAAIVAGEPVNGMVTVTFKGKERRKKKTEGNDAPAASSEPAAEDTGTATANGEPATAENSTDSPAGKVSEPVAS